MQVNLQQEVLKLEVCSIMKMMLKNIVAKLHKSDQNHNIYVAQMGHWVSWSDNTDNAEDFEYSNKDLNNLMKSHKENQEKQDN